MQKPMKLYIYTRSPVVCAKKVFRCDRERVGECISKKSTIQLYICSLSLWNGDNKTRVNQLAIYFIIVKHGRIVQISITLKMVAPIKA